MRLTVCGVQGLIQDFAQGDGGGGRMLKCQDLRKGQV